MHSISNIELNMFCIGISLKIVMQGGSISCTESFYLGKLVQETLGV